MRERISLDLNWRFKLGDEKVFSNDLHHLLFAKAGGANGAPSQQFDDTSWRTVDIPHDWVVELEFDPEDKGSTDYIFHGYKPVGWSYPSTSIGWYRRSFEITKEDEGKRLSLEFDGIYRDSIVWLNGHYLGRHGSGYTPFRYDISDIANYEGKNVLVVRADASHNEGWWYEGAGIYRHVWLVKVHPLHVTQWGVFVTTESNDRLANVKATIHLTNENENERNCQVISVILDDINSEITRTTSSSTLINPWSKQIITHNFTINEPKLWSIESPTLYRMITIVKLGDIEVDKYETYFGIRTIHFNPDNGFFLNGKHVLIKGLCGHPDHAGVGAAIPDRLHEYRLKLLNEMGANAVRAPHCCPSQEWLDFCDRLGILVIDEHRLFGSSPEILNQFRTLIKRDRNHPSIILWSLGNEEFVQSSKLGERVASSMKRIVKQLDPTRSITFGSNNGSDYSGINSIVDVRGWNYLKLGNIDDYHEAHPEQPIIGTEEASTLCTRGIYENNPQKGYVSAYDDNPPDWGMTAEGWWKYYVSRPFLAGGFVWTGFDYRGEPTPYKWPCISSHFGILDTCGFPKDNYYYYQSWWSDKIVLHLFPHWNWPGKEGQEIDVRCFSNCDRVELFLNGKSLGMQKMPYNSHLKWRVKYEPGILEAIGYKDNKKVALKKIETTDLPAALKLIPGQEELKIKKQDIVVINVAVIDKKGCVVPTADNEITFDITNNARILGVGNGNPSSHEPDKASRRKVFNGLCQVIVQSLKESGIIQITAESPQLEPATVRMSILK